MYYMQSVESINPIRAIDLFCGIGGNSWGARESGVQIVAGFDMWDLAGKVYKDNFPEATFFSGKLQETIIRGIHNQLGNIDLIVASPECTSHSIARGNKKRNKESLNLAYQVLRFAKEFKPRWIVIENVIGMKNWDGYSEFLKKLGESYKYLEQPLKASDFGVHQSRRRLFILFDRLLPPNPIEILNNSKDLQVKDILNNNGAYKFTPLITPKRAKSTIERAKRAFTSIGEEEPFLMVYYGSDAAGGWQKLDLPLRTITTVDRFALVRPDGNGGHEMRMLQPPELQKAMGFPSQFKLVRGTRREKIHLLGNAVCPPVMKAIVQALISSGKKEETLELKNSQR